MKKIIFLFSFIILLSLIVNKVEALNIKSLSSEVFNYIQIWGTEGRRLDVNQNSQEIGVSAVSFTSKNRSGTTLEVSGENEKMGVIKIGKNAVLNDQEASALSIELKEGSQAQGVFIKMNSSTNKSIHIIQNGQQVFYFACPENKCVLRVNGDIEYTGNLIHK